MTGPADVRSLPALVDWHAQLATFRQEALESLGSLAMEVRRATDYLDEQLHFWRDAVRDCEEEVIQCRYDLSRRQVPDFSGRIPDCSVQEEALRRAERRLEYAQEQVAVVRRWMNHLPREINEVYESVARRYETFVEIDVQHALNTLQKQILLLEAYVQSQAPVSSPPPVSGGESPAGP